MRRDPNALPAPPVVPDVSGQPPAGMVRQVRRYELITPLFGGGVVPQQADPVTTVRGAEIRGHLRFWWRACRGGQYGGSLARMKEAEDALWGAGGGEQGPKPSQVILETTVLNSGRPFVVRDRQGNTVPIGHFRSLYSYVAFPLQQNLSAIVLQGITFDLIISFPAKQQEEVEAALWAWQNFGGIGGRTRRGFGALCCTHIDDRPFQLPSTESVRDTLRQGLAVHVVPGAAIPGLPHLGPTTQLQTTDNKQDSLLAWQHLIQKLKKFRQDRDRKPQSNQPGLSRWPEPDAVRRRFPGQRFTHAARPGVDKFPRAAFGLPIVFHFKDAGDPPETTLQGGTVGRLASPLLLRPLRCADGAVGIGMILQGTRNVPGGWQLHNAPGNPSVATTLDAADAAAIPALRGQPDVLLAFLNSLEE